MNDEKLVRQFADEGSEDAFAQIVSRYLKMVYATCLREVCDAELAQDVAQTVFLLLAQKASRLKEGTVISGWLFTTARLAGRNALRELRRRRHYEAQMVTQMPHYDDWQAVDETATMIEPWLNDALARLSAKDREALLLRYAEERSLHEIGERYGISENAAHMRVTRALERLRAGLTKRGVEAPALSALSGALTLVLAGAILTLPAKLSAAEICRAVPRLLAGKTHAAAAKPGFHPINPLIAKGILIVSTTKLVAGVAGVVLILALIFVVVHHAHSTPTSGSSAAQSVTWQAGQQSDSVTEQAVQQIRADVVQSFSWNPQEHMAAFSPNSPRYQQEQREANQPPPSPLPVIQITVESCTITGDKATARIHAKMTQGAQSVQRNGQVILVNTGGKWLIMNYN